MRVDALERAYATHHYRPRRGSQAGQQRRGVLSEMGTTIQALPASAGMMNVRQDCEACEGRRRSVRPKANGLESSEGQLGCHRICARVGVVSTDRHRDETNLKMRAYRMGSSWFGQRTSSLEQMVLGQQRQRVTTPTPTPRVAQRPQTCARSPNHTEVVYRDSARLTM